MSVWLVEVYHSRYIGSWSDYFLVVAETEEEAKDKCGPGDGIEALEVDMKRLEREPWLLGDSDSGSIWLQTD